MTVTATFIRQLDRENLPVDARLYRLSEPVRYRYWEGSGSGYKEVTKKATYIVVSGSYMPPLPQPETYIFPADETGAIINWTELPGSFQGSVDHEKALRDAGFTVEHAPEAAGLSDEARQDIEQRLTWVYARMTPLPINVMNATRNADRLSLANEIDSLRLEIDLIRSLVKDDKSTETN